MSDYRAGVLISMLVRSDGRDAAMCFCPPLLARRRGRPAGRFSYVVASGGGWPASAASGVVVWV